MSEKPIELLISIFAGISVGFGLESLMKVTDDALWFGFSIFAIIFTTAFIWIILDVGKLKFKEVIMMITLAFLIFFPFTLAKADQNSTSSIFDWTGNTEIIYSIFMGISFIIWGAAEIKDKNRRVKGSIIVAFGIFIIILLIFLSLLIKTGVMNFN